MFIFAKCVLTELYQQPSRDHLFREWGAERFPTELEEVYVISPIVEKVVLTNAW